MEAGLVDLTQEVVLWTYDSSVAIGVALEVGGEVVEDAAWLRRAGDAGHINMSELEAAIRGINMCLRWKIWQFTLQTDSATVCGWLKALFQRTHRVWTRTLGEMLQELAEQERLEVEVEFVGSARNKADALTHVPRKWLAHPKDKEDKAHHGTTSL